MGSWTRIALAAAVVLPLGGCFQSTTIIKVKGDGSGTIEQRTLVTEAALDQLKAFTILGGGAGGDVDPVSESQARSLATALGPNVTYVSSMPLKTDRAQGREALYSFTDVSQLRISEQPQMPGGISVRGQGVNTDGSPITFALIRQPDGNAVLRVLVPSFTALSAGDPAGGVSLPSFPAAAQIQMAKQLLAGARLSVALEPDGSIVKTSSPYVDGPRVTLIEIDVDEAAKDPTLLARLQSVTTIDEAKAAINAIPGLKLSLEPEITIEFKPAH
jgi:hypothetical protein